ncbi:rhomboid family intramembrane serine protease [Fontisphaera persica]|uniref:rhomboid family intramembrane serine protease n=1 Tax=Fontisphaera persica TaxID=2974023 RepID=UPI0024C07BF1|nr:rhomboid family intramembrane serine protease [Fontisphaera persica]WCJ60279.1 rhomboid family intramembrane serine protease [Fontisphaera persica]
MADARIPAAADAPQKKWFKLQIHSILSHDMRQIGIIANESQARIFSHCLVAKGIANEVEAEGPNQWAVWVHDEDRLAEAAGLLQRFLSNPTATEWKEAARQAARLLEEEQRELREYAKRVHNSEEVLPRYRPFGAGLMTLILIGICAYVAVLSKAGKNMEAIIPLMIANPMKWAGQLTEVRQGEFWRLITPIFIHYGPLHLIFNMLWLFQLGSLIEARKGSLYFLLMVGVIAIGSNLAQYLMVNPRFGGMSGVVYGLFGYAWMRGKYDPSSGMTLASEVVLLMLLWFGVCWFGLVGPIANAAHTAGLVMGMGWGFLSAKLRH